MNLNTLFAALGGGAKIITTASSAAIILGAVYLVDCRISTKTAEEIESCYFTAMPIMGIGITGRGAFAMGYNTYNPALRKEEELGERGRDEHGRFVKRNRD